MGTGCASSFALSLPTSLSLSLSSARVHEHRALFFPRLSTDHTIRLLSCYRPIARRVNGGMRDNCATLQNAFGAISIYSSIENIYTCNSFSRSSRFIRASISSLPRLDLTNVLIRFVGLGKWIVSWLLFNWYLNCTSFVDSFGIFSFHRWWKQILRDRSNLLPIICESISR